MVKGGYQIINLENKPLTNGVGMVYEGIYDKIEGTRKTILISGLNIDEIEYRDFYCTPELDGTNFVCTCNNIKLVITDNDILTVYETNREIVFDEDFTVQGGRYTPEFEVVKNSIKVGTTIRDDNDNIATVISHYIDDNGNLLIFVIHSLGVQDFLIKPNGQYDNII